MSAIRILQLYPDELGVAGDRGNVLALATRLQRAGFEVELFGYSVGDILPRAADLVVVGNGPLSAMRTVHDDLLVIAPRLLDWAQRGVPVFAYGSGAELLGREITLLDGSTMAGIGLFPFTAQRVTLRKVGYVVTRTAAAEVVGFEDNASFWQLDEGAAAFGSLVQGGGNGPHGAEGVIVGSSIATQVGGPVLPLNPRLTDSIIASVPAASGYAPGPAHDDLDRYAREARAVIAEHVSHVFSRI
ncbi:glutamine amidotransferase [soil metagenome]